MNQILATETKKEKSNGLEVKGIVRFFAIAIIIFGITMLGEGVYSIYRKIEDTSQANSPTVSISRYNDKAIIYVENKIEINKIIYSWNEGEQTQIPEGGVTAREEILLPNEDSTLNIIIEDSNGKQISYKKEFLLTGVDITKPSIKVETSNGSSKMTIIAKDETGISSISYQWDDEEEPTYVDATEEGQKEIKQEIDLQPGTKTIKIIAQDTNGNIEEVEKEIVATTSKPKVSLIPNGKELRIEIQDQDGIKDVEVNVNGEIKSAQNINRKHIKVGPIILKEGNNTINIKVTNVSGYTGSITKELQYTP